MALYLGGSGVFKGELYFYWHDGDFETSHLCLKQMNALFLVCLVSMVRLVLLNGRGKRLIE